MAADFCLMVWGGDPLSVTTPPELAGFARFGVLVFPNYRLAIIVIAFVVAIGLWLLLDRTRLGAMIRAGVDDPDMARVVGIRVSQLFTIVFALGAGLAAFAGIIGGPILSVYPGLDQDMLPLALVVVILGGTGSLLGSFVGSIIVGFIYNFGQALLPELAYFVLFFPMLLVLLFLGQLPTNVPQVEHRTVQSPLFQFSIARGEFSEAVDQLRSGFWNDKDRKKAAGKIENNVNVFIRYIRTVPRTFQ